MQASLLTRFTLILACSAISLACSEPVHQGEYAAVAVDRGLPILDQPQLLPGDLPEGRTTLRYGVTPYLGATMTRQAYAPIAAWISTRLGVPVEFVLTNSYDALIASLKKGRVDIVQLSPLSYILALNEVPSLRLVASSLSFGSASYSSLLIVRSGSRLRRLRDVIPLKILEKRAQRQKAGNGKLVPIPSERKVKFGYVHESSASGYLLPYQALLHAGVDPVLDLKMYRLGSHEAAVEALNAGRVDMVAVSSGTLNNVRRGVIIGQGNLRILHKAGRVPYDAVCTSPAVPISGAKKIAAAFGALSTRTAAGRKVLSRARGVTGWSATSDARYDFMRRILARVRNEGIRHLDLRRRQLDLPAALTRVTP